MKFLASIGVFLGMTVILTAGMLLLMKGSPWLLIVSVVGLIVMFTKFGCLSSH